MATKKIRCGECGKEVSRSRTTECMGCLKRFHASCLHKVRKRRVSYRMCSSCLKNDPSPARTVLNESPNLESPAVLSGTQIGSIKPQNGPMH